MGPASTAPILPEGGAKGAAWRGAASSWLSCGMADTRMRASKALETFPNPNPGRDYAIHMQIPEFTCLCPKTGQPDFATLYLDYIADRKCVELKSLSSTCGRSATRAPSTRPSPTGLPTTSSPPSSRVD